MRTLPQQVIPPPSSLCTVPAMESISVFDIFKIGVGPSSSHTMGPWRATQRFLADLDTAHGLGTVQSIKIELFGSLAKTGRGHGTDTAIILALGGEDPVTCEVAGLHNRVRAVRQSKAISVLGRHKIAFDPAIGIEFHMDRAHPAHANALTFTALTSSGAFAQTYFSVGGGFVVRDGQESDGRQRVSLPFPIEHGHELAAHCTTLRSDIARVVLENEKAWRTESGVRTGLLDIWRVMRECIYRGCHTAGTLPGGLNVARRAASMNHKLLGIAGAPGTVPSSAGTLGETVPVLTEGNISAWREAVKLSASTFQDILKWVSTFALAVNEENASFGRVVTAPTNGAAGVIPAVLMYADLFCSPRIGNSQTQRDDSAIAFLLVAGEIGSLFKKGATLSAAMGGCQAEIGVSSAMAAAGLTHWMGGTPAQAMMAAEIAMEHHLGMTCDPIGGLVQVPCIERNTMGAIKAITAANIAIESDPAHAKVSLDDVIRTMWATAKDMNHKYKETAEGGLAVQISVSISEC